MFSREYPNLEWWINTHGWIEMGDDDYSTSWVRILDIGGLCWEDKSSESLDEALKNGDIWASNEIKERFGEEPPKKYGENE
jgi:hypothetical protein